MTRCDLTALVWGPITESDRTCCRTMHSFIFMSFSLLHLSFCHDDWILIYNCGKSPAQSRRTAPATSLFSSCRRFKSCAYWYKQTWLELTLNLHVFAVHASELCALRVLQRCSGNCLQSILQKMMSGGGKVFFCGVSSNGSKSLNSLGTQSWWEFSKSSKSRSSYRLVAPFCPRLLPLCKTRL